METARSFDPFTGREVTGRKVQIWAWIEDDVWIAECPNLEGAKAAHPDFDEAVGLCIHYLASIVNEHKNNKTRIPWQEIGDRQPPADAIVRYRGVS